MAAPFSEMNSWPRVSITRSGSIVRFARTIGCFTRRIPRTFKARAATRADLYLPAMACWSPRWRRKAWSASGEKPDCTMKYWLAGCIVLISFVTAALGASGRQHAPPGSFDGAPPQFTHFTSAELSRGFLALAFGSDLRIGARPLGIRRFDHPIRARVIGGGMDRSNSMSRVIEQYAHEVPNLALSIAPSPASADVELRLIDEKDFQTAL